MTQTTPDLSSALPRLRVFCDFDGTISTVDIGDALFDHFGTREPWHADLMAGRLHIREYWKKVASALHTAPAGDALDRFLAAIPIDPGLDDLLQVCRESSLPFAIVSDGLDLYIERYLELHGIAPLPLFCNRARLTSSGGLDISYPFAAEACDCLCATCKRNVVLTEAGPEEIIVYIGDGVSDFCPAAHSDIVFAKRHLAAYCNEHRIPHYPFATLADVAIRLRQIIQRRKVRPRHQAVLLRKAAWEGE